MPRRAHLEASARRGSVSALESLVGPEVPETFAYLRDWAWELYGRSGVAGMGALAPLAYSTIAHWARLKRIRLQPFEVDVLIVLDAAIRNPGGAAKSPASTQAAQQPRGAEVSPDPVASARAGGISGAAVPWPTRRTDGPSQVAEGA